MVMRLVIDVEIECQISAGDAVLLMVEAASGDGQSVVQASLNAEGAELRRPTATAVWAILPSDQFKLHYHAVVDVTREETSLATLTATPHEDLPGDVVPFLRPSRYCQSDLFTEFAEQQFGAHHGGAKVAAIRDWISTELTYTSGSSNAATTAVETFADRKGVCRDFAHLLCTLARAAQIPARYASVYGAHVDPEDFHAVAQVWLDGAWHLVDATGMGGPESFAVIATGRDAAEVAYMETANWAHLLRQNVSVSEG